jgi:dihydromonapterin reductase/dihydrofolate reductase
MADSLLEEGNAVVVTYRTLRPTIEKLKDKGATAIYADFSTEQAIDRAIDDIKAASESYRAIIHNALAPYRINLALAHSFSNQDGFSDIIHMTDYVQDTGSEKHMAYAASKAALHNLTLSFAKKLAPHVKVNSIAPALLMFNEGDDEAYKQKALKKSLLETVPGAQEAVKAMHYLLNSDYITGQTLHLNGGRHLK